MTTTLRVALIGAGRMGRPIGDRVLGAGLDLTVCARSDGGAQYFADRAAVCLRPVDLASGSDIVLVVVRNDEQLISALTGPDGALPQLEAGSIVVVHSTVHPDTLRHLAHDGDRYGVNFLDAPVSGGEARAAGGELVAYIGGDEEVVREATPVMATYCAQLHTVGPVGGGQIIKILNNMLSNINTAAAYEALNLAGASGLDSDVVRTLLMNGSGASHALADWTSPRKDQYDPASPIAERANRLIAAKDIALANELAQRYRAPSPLLTLVESLMRDLVEERGHAAREADTDSVDSGQRGVAREHTAINR